MSDYRKVIQNAIDHIKKGGKILFRRRCPGKQMSHHYFLNEDHSYRPCTLMEWAKQFEARDRKVGNDIINGKHISTVWLGLNHNYGNGAPLLFETMIFRDKTDSTDKVLFFNEIYLERYSTWKEAEEGHQKAIEWVKNGCKKCSHSYITQILIGDSYHDGCKDCGYILGVSKR